MAIKIAINGFGRIGRNVLRIASNYDDIDIVACNDLSHLDQKVHLLKYDSNYGVFDKKVEISGDSFSVEGDKILAIEQRAPEELPWKELDVDVVIESTGIFRKREDATKHLKAGAKKVIISAPSPDPDATVVLGVNEEIIDKENHSIVSNASCTTNCLAPVAKVINDAFSIDKASMTTVHSYTMDQKLLDSYHPKDHRRARSAALSIVPTSTGAAKAVGIVIPSLAGKIDGFSLRVPTPTVSVVDLTAIVEKSVTVDDINNVLCQAAASEKVGSYLDVCDQPLVSIDFKQNPASSIVDLLSTDVIGGTLIKIVSWYDNEWGYSNRVVDLARYLFQ